MPVPVPVPVPETEPVPAPVPVRVVQRKAVIGVDPGLDSETDSGTAGPPAAAVARAEAALGQPWVEHVAGRTGVATSAGGATAVVVGESERAAAAAEIAEAAAAGVDVEVASLGLVGGQETAGSGALLLCC